MPQVVRQFFSRGPRTPDQPDILINLSNDGWFHETSEHEMHLAVSTFRCIENRVPLARAVNTGISAMIDGNGRIIKSLAKLKAKGVLAENARRSTIGFPSTRGGATGSGNPAWPRPWGSSPWAPSLRVDRSLGSFFTTQPA